VARTLQTFQLLGLAAGETIHLVSVHREGWEAGALARLACDFLAAHGAACQFHDLTSKADPADVLLEQVQSLQPRLLVMGAHGYHPQRDLFATSVTRTVLRACPVPVFIGA
jgi:nucleotide-binding universal stress UspA family protein